MYLPGLGPVSFAVQALFRLRPAWTWNKLTRAYLDNHALRDYYQDPQAAGYETGTGCSDNTTVDDDVTEGNCQDEIPPKKVTTVFLLIKVTL